LAVHADDQMLLFLRDLYEGDNEQALCAYYRSGASIARLMVEVLRWRFGAPGRVSSLLDFASGYGRVTRFLLDEVPSGSLCAADILPAAVDFQRRAFGIRAVMSASRPEQLSLPGSFDAILVTSLFTHLPERSFGAWLAALLARLAPGGVLAFSTHDVALLPDEKRPAEGYRFEPHSEIAELATAEYGSTWVDEPFVRAALAAAGRPLSAIRFPRAVCDHQDLWVVVPDAGESFAGLAPPSEPELWLESCVVTARELALRGWAHHRNGAVTRLEASLDGLTLGTTPVDLRRDDIAAVRGPGAVTSGWELRVPLPPAADVHDSVLVLRGVDERGGTQPLWVGRLLTAAFHARVLQERTLRVEVHGLHRQLGAHRAWAEQEIAIMQGRVAAMEASRFWKLRNAWFRLKRALRLTEES
jgi:SAM-dependent methyltransferase